MLRTYQEAFDDLYVIETQTSENEIFLGLPRKEAIDGNELARRAAVFPTPEIPLRHRQVRGRRFQPRGHERAGRPRAAGQGQAAEPRRHENRSIGIGRSVAVGVHATHAAHAAPRQRGTYSSPNLKARDLHLFEQHLCDQVQIVLPHRPLMTAGIQVPDVLHLLLGETLIQSLGPIQQTVAIAAGNPEQLQLGIERLGIGIAGGDIRLGRRGRSRR